MMSIPTAPRRKPTRMKARSFDRRGATEANEGAKRQELHAEELRRTKVQQNSATGGCKKVTRMMAKAAPMKDDMKAAVSACPPNPCFAMGCPSRSWPLTGLTRNIEENRGDRPQTGLPVDARQQYNA